MPATLHTTKNMKNTLKAHISMWLGGFVSNLEWNVPHPQRSTCSEMVRFGLGIIELQYNLYIKMGSCIMHLSMSSPIPPPLAIWGDLCILCWNSVPHGWAFVFRYLAKAMQSLSCALSSIA